MFVVSEIREEVPCVEFEREIFEIYIYLIYK